MEFFIGAGELLLLTRLLSFVVHRDESVVYSRILIETDESNNSILFYAGNGSVSIKFRALDCDIIKHGTCSILYNNINKFLVAFNYFDIESGIGVKNFKFKLNEKTLSIFVENILLDNKSSKSKLSVNIFNTNEYYKPPSFERSDFALNSTMFKNGIQKVSYAVNPDINLESIKGINIKFDKDNIYFIGTDSVLMSEYSVKNISAISDSSYHIKLDFVKVLSRVIYEESQLLFEINDNLIKAKFGNISVTGCVIVGHEYPDCTSIFNNYTNTIKIEKEFLIQATKSLVGISNQDDNNRVTLSIAEGYLEIYNDNSVISYSEQLDYKDTFVIDLNCKLLFNSLASIKDDMLIIKFSDEHGYFIIDSFNFEDQKCLINNIKRR